ncbi:uncharacterized protein C1orf131 homolog [Ictalurus furcatus]|uniref:uncharacterized protein C1orf131 homolog n=1 Tax=Ictalurus furcatus TaxID=66913 RepID=UPI0023507E83|nr:uncharacterized protein C1orf131 homolog [Ictalurus furcatus]
MKRTERESREDFDADRDFLDQVLNKLYDFGDGPDDKRSKKAHKKRKRITQEDEEDVPAQEDDSDQIDGETDAASDERVSASTSADSGTLEKKTPRVEIVTFQDPLKKNTLKRAVEPDTRPAEGKEKKKTEPDVLSMEKARLDVHRFGITGFQKQQQRVFEQDRAIMLGARPPKKDYVNYKAYQQMIKDKKSKEKEEEAKSDAQKKKKKWSGKQKNVKRKSGSSGADPTGHVGRFKNGMLVLSSKDIQNLNRKVRK